MKVYIVFHADIEDDRYVRAVCATEEKAKQIANSSQVCRDDHPHFNWDRSKVVPSIHYFGSAKTPQIPTTAEDCIRTHDHFTLKGTQESLCCGVEEWEVE